VGPLGPWKLSDGAGKIPSAHSAAEAAEAAEAVEAAEAEEEAEEAEEAVEAAETVEAVEAIEDAMAHRVRTRPGLAMALDALGPLGPSFATKRTRRAHALLSTLGGVSGPRRIAESASKPVPCVPLERPPERHAESAESRPIVSAASVHIGRENKKEKTGLLCFVCFVVYESYPRLSSRFTKNGAKKSVFAIVVLLFCSFLYFPGAHSAGRSCFTRTHQTYLTGV
jgi:hypothetical protein